MLTAHGVCLFDLLPKEILDNKGGKEKFKLDLNEFLKDIQDCLISKRLTLPLVNHSTS